MVRMQIQLTPEQAREISERATARRISVAEYVRRAVDAALLNDPKPLTLEERAERWEISLSAVGKHQDVPGLSVAEDHDRYLDEAYGDWESKRRA